jgi:hypothetical protein
MMRSIGVKRLAVGGAVVLFGLVFGGPGAFAGASVNEQGQAGGQSAEHRQDRDANSPSNDEASLNEPQPASTADFSGSGANQHGAYDSTRDGSASENGNGDGAAVGRPCAGCVGKADNKNPAGQFPDGTDANNGYECDGNAGIGRTNPAHTGCLIPNTPVTPNTPGTPTDRNVTSGIFVLAADFFAGGPATTVRPAVGTLAATGSGSGLTTIALTGTAMILVGSLVVLGYRRWLVDENVGGCMGEIRVE